MAAEGGRYAREWSNFRMRVRRFWIVCLGYPVVGALLGYWFRGLLPALAIVLIVGFPLTIFALASRIRAWPCPQCDKSFVYFPSASSEGNVFTIRACGHCGLPKWGDSGGTPPLVSTAALTDPTQTSNACWFCGRPSARGRALELSALDTRSKARLLTVPRCRRCANVHYLQER